MAREKKIPYYYDLTIHKLRVKLGLEGPIVKLPTGNYTKGDLNEMARDQGIRGFFKNEKTRTRRAWHCPSRTETQTYTCISNAVQAMRECVLN